MGDCLTARGGSTEGTDGTFKGGSQYDGSGGEGPGVNLNAGPGDWSTIMAFSSSVSAASEVLSDMGEITV